MSSDKDTLARTLYGEARGEGDIGMQAVANVVCNRVALAHKHPHFGDGSIASACTAKYQFSCWNENDPNSEKLKTVTDEDPSFAAALDIAADAVDGYLQDITGGATYYYVKNSPMPTWADGKTPCAAIGRHLFFKDIA